RAAREPGGADRRGLADRHDRPRRRAGRRVARQLGALRARPRPARGRLQGARPHRHGGAREARAARGRERGHARQRHPRARQPGRRARAGPRVVAREALLERVRQALPRDRARPPRPGRAAAALEPRGARRRRLGARVPVVARGHDLLGLLRGAAEPHRQARPDPPAGRRVKFELSDDQALLRSSTRDFLARACPFEASRRTMEHDSRGYDSALWQGLAEMGYLGLTVPARAGGQGLGTVELAIVLEAVGRGCLPGPYLDVVLAATLLAAPVGPPGLLERVDLVAAVGAGAMLLGIMARLLEMTIAHVQTRQAFRRPIGAFQVLQHRLADMLLKTESTRSAVYRAAWCLDTSDADAALACAAAKAYAGDASRLVCGEAIQMHGGIGFTWELDLHFYFKRAKTLEQHYGSTESQLERALAAAGY